MITDTDPTPPDPFACGCVPLFRTEPALPHPRPPAQVVAVPTFLGWADDPPWEVPAPQPDLTSSA